MLHTVKASYLKYLLSINSFFSIVENKHLKDLPEQNPAQKKLHSRSANSMHGDISIIFFILIQIFKFSGTFGSDVYFSLKE